MKNTVEQTNDLRYTAIKTAAGMLIEVKIRLNDECKNGHQDFSITGSAWAAGKPRTDRYMISCGCIHDIIAEHFPEFIPFIRLHLSDYDGVPMYAVENGHYHMREGFNTTKPGSPDFPKEYCDYYRINPAQFEALSTARNTVQFAVTLEKTGVLTQWKEEAQKAILELERLTCKQFLNDSVKSQYHAPTVEQLAEEDKKQKEGYYTPEAEKLREEARVNAEFAELEAERVSKIDRVNNEYDTKKEVLVKGGSKALKNCIYYTHTQTVAFNWRNYDNLPVEFINDLIKKLVLPDGVKAEISKNK